MQKKKDSAGHKLAVQYDRRHSILKYMV